ncbi:MAG: L-beta-lysine 5,6-aminomutase beta subunit @ D-lysine 5,6-aminomutase beta subunit, partial [uncultured Nocardioides sp.]
ERGDRRQDHPAVRRHHGRRDGAGVLHPADAALQGRRGCRRAARREDGHRPGPGRARQADGPRLHVLRGLRAGQPPRRPLPGAGRRARLPAADAQGGQRRHQALAAAQAGGRGRLHRHRRPHGRHRRHPQHQGLRRGEGPGVLPRAQGGQPRGPGQRPAAGRGRARGEGRRRARLPGGHPARRPPPQHPGDVGGLPRGLPLGDPAAARRRRTALRRGDGRRARRRPGLQPRHHPGRGRLLHRPPHDPRAERQEGLL